MKAREMIKIQFHNGEYKLERENLIYEDTFIECFHNAFESLLIVIQKRSYLFKEDILSFQNETKGLINEFDVITFHGKIFILKLLDDVSSSRQSIISHLRKVVQSRIQVNANYLETVDSIIRNIDHLRCVNDTSDPTFVTFEIQFGEIIDSKGTTHLPENFPKAFIQYLNSHQNTDVFLGSACYECIKDHSNIIFKQKIPRGFMKYLYSKNLSEESHEGTILDLLSEYLKFSYESEEMGEEDDIYWCQIHIPEIFRGEPFIRAYLCQQMISPCECEYCKRNEYDKVTIAIPSENKQDEKIVITKDSVLITVWRYRYENSDDSEVNIVPNQVIDIEVRNSKIKGDFLKQRFTKRFVDTYKTLIIENYLKNKWNQYRTTKVPYVFTSLVTFNHKISTNESSSDKSSFSSKHEEKKL